MALHKDQLILHINAQHAHILHRPVVTAHAAWHALSWPHTTWVLIVSDGAGRAVRERGTVGCISPCKVVSLHDTREAFPPCDGTHIHILPRDKMRC